MSCLCKKLLLYGNLAHHADSSCCIETRPVLPLTHPCQKIEFSKQVFRRAKMQCEKITRERKFGDIWVQACRSMGKLRSIG